jgi:hypothetical protein
MARNQPEFAKRGHMGEARKKIPKNHDIDQQVEESFPASDPPSYAGGAHAGAPAHRGTAPSKSHKEHKG